VALGTDVVRVAANFDLTATPIEFVLVCLPDKLTVCGLAPPLSLMETVPVKVPLLEELKVTVIMHDFPDPTLESQLFVWEKALEPVIVILAMFRVVLPTFVRVIVCGGGGQVLGSSWQEKDRLVGTSFTTVPVPVTLAVCGLPGALSVTDNVAVRDPRCVGLKVTLIVQLAPATTELAQVLVW
jgi:hypothetical protein